MKVETKVIDHESNLVLLSITGRVKSGYLQPLEIELLKLGQIPGVKVVLDAQGVDSIDSSGIGEIIKARMEISARGGRIVLLGSNSRVEMLIKLSGLANYFPVAATFDQAVELLNQPQAPSEPLTDPEAS